MSLLTPDVNNTGIKSVKSFQALMQVLRLRAVSDKDSFSFSKVTKWVETLRGYCERTLMLLLALIENGPLRSVHTDLLMMG